MAKYIYCVTECLNKKLDVHGIRGTGAHLIPYKDISAAVSDVAFEELDPTDENLLAHEKVNQKILIDCGCCVAPMAFCTIAASEEDVIKILREGYYTFKKNLLILKNKVEFGVKVFCDIEEFSSKHGSEMYGVSREIAEDIFKQINALAENSRLNDLVIENMIMNASFLLEKNRATLFKDAINEVDKKYGGKFLIRLAGPMSAYSFVEMPDDLCL